MREKRPLHSQQPRAASGPDQQPNRREGAIRSESSHTTHNVRTEGAAMKVRRQMFSVAWLPRTHRAPRTRTCELA